MLKNQSPMLKLSIGPNTLNIAVYKMKKLLKNLWQAFLEARLEAAKARTQYHNY